MYDLCSHKRWKEQLYLTKMYFNLSYEIIFNAYQINDVQKCILEMKKYPLMHFSTSDLTTVFI